MESFTTELADKRFVSCVDADVRVECGAPVEGFSALVALVRLLLNKPRPNKQTNKRNTSKSERVESQQQQHKNTAKEKEATALKDGLRVSVLLACG